MQKNQSLESLTSKILKRISDLIKRIKPDLVLVHGDTTSTLSSSLACYYNKTKVAHVEAGLRTGNIYSPWPEEINRKFTAQISEINFSPTLSLARFSKGSFSQTVWSFFKYLNISFSKTKKPPLTH